MDYDKIGFKAGLEIHQQLDSGKLFCNCPGVLISENPDYTIKRKLHAVAGETGEIDIAAKFQAQQEKDFIYQGHYGNTCLVELDEEPPHEINYSALKIVLQIAFLLNCEPLRYSQIMRKTVIDGSNTSGFQRTVFIAKDGFIETSFGKVRIDSIALEEDAARLIEKREDKVVYRLDRLGIPLVEIATAPDLKNAEQVKEAALKIGEVLRACKVKRGIGTIRQDVNVSIKGHDRVEIKGFQDVKMMVKTIDFEVERQMQELKQGKKKGEVRNALPSGESEFLRPIPGAARMYPETDLQLLKISKNIIDDARRELPRLRTELREELMNRGLNEELIKLILEEDKVEDFKEMAVYSTNNNLIAKMLTLYIKGLAVKKEKDIEQVNKILNKDVLVFVLEQVEKKKISESQVKDILEKILDGMPVMEAVKIEKQDVNELENKVMKLIKEKPGLSENAYMGLLMKEFKGKVDGKTLKEIIERYLK
ncbi:MAG: Glu-tRNA(Gln) amidotransferase subunit GatE [Nanoarchaeota archaeon]